MAFGAVVKTVHHGNATMTGAASATGSGAWDKDKSVLVFTFSHSNSGTVNPSIHWVRGAITNDTTVTFTRATTTDNVIIEWQVIEYY